MNWKQCAKPAIIVLALLLINALQLLPSTVIASVLSTSLGTDQLVALSTPDGIGAALSYIAFICVYSTISQIGSQLETRPSSAGKRMMIAALLAPAFGLVIGCVIAALAAPLSALYQLSPAVVRISHANWIVQILVVPICCLNFALIGILEAQHSVLLVLLMLLVSGAVAVLLLLTFFVWTDVAANASISGISGALFAQFVVLIGLTLNISLASCVLCSRRKRFALQWSSFREIRKELFFDSLKSFGWMILKGVGQMFPYLFFPIVASRIFGEEKYAAYLIFLTMVKYVTYLSDAAGVASNIVISAHPSVKYYYWLLPLLTLALLGLPFTLVSVLLRRQLIALFSKNAAVIASLEQIWMWMIILQPFNSLVGIFEGILYGLRAFKQVALCQIAGWLVFLPATVVSAIRVDYSLFVASFFLYYLARLAPLPFVVLYLRMKANRGDKGELQDPLLINVDQ